MHAIDLLATASQLPHAWRSHVVARPAQAQFKVLRMDASAYPAEVHDFDEALLVLEGCMRLEIGGRITEVQGGQVLLVPAGQEHAVAAGSHGTLVIIDA